MGLRLSNYCYYCLYMYDYLQILEGMKIEMFNKRYIRKNEYIIGQLTWKDVINTPVILPLPPYTYKSTA